MPCWRKSVPSSTGRLSKKSWWIQPHIDSAEPWRKHAPMKRLALVFALIACAKQSESRVEAKAPTTQAAPTGAAQDTKRIRRAQVAGSWYPSDKEQLAAAIDALLADAKPPKLDGKT